MNPNIIIILISFSCGVLSILALLRFMMQLARVNVQNKAVLMICRITDVYCFPLRKILPYYQHADFASFIMAAFMQALGFYLIYLLFSSEVPDIKTIATWSFVVVIGLFLRIYFMALLLMVIFSWVRPQGASAIAELSNQLVEPLLRPFHKLVPPIAGMDFSPMALFFLVYLLQSVWRSVAAYIEVPLSIVFGV